MFAHLSALALIAPLVSAFTFSGVPSGWHSGDQVSVNWTTTPSDPTSFSLELQNPDLFHQALALANNVDTSSGTVAFTLPIVPASSGYTLQAVNITNINQVYSESGSFSIADPVSSSAASSSTTSSGAASSGSASATGSATIQPITTSFGITVSNTNTAASTVSTGAASGSGSSASSPTPTSFNGNGALSQMNFGVASWAVMGLTAVFGCMAAL
ncbi:hypothetical protein K474DRAFT_1704192 [Panus rudis PR-1116 ss-1]|nr:hypothetical protein K474DRAFT_1704192 [Panus rudis PR-1116 ss-1]